LRKVVLIAGFCVVGLWQLLFVNASAGDEWGLLVHQEDSLYHGIFVYKKGSVVTLRFSRQPAVQVQSQVDLSNLQDHRLEYTVMSFCGLLYKPQPRRMLVLGLGGGTIPREMHHYFPALEIDVAEIDPQIRKIAAEFFGFTEDNRMRVNIADGRMFIKQRLRKENAEKYDIVILDAFNSDYIPFHLMTKEFLDEVKSVLAEDGAVVANVFQNNRLFDAELATFIAVFGRCQVFVGTYSTNAMLVSPGPNGKILTVQEAVSQARILQRKVNFAFDMVTVASRLRPEIHPDPQIKILTDDRAPVNWLREQKRKDVTAK